MFQIEIGALFASNIRIGFVVLGALSAGSLTSCGVDPVQVAAAAADSPAQVNEIDAATAQSIAVDSESGGIGQSGTSTATSCSLSTARSSCSGAAFSVLWSSCLLTSQATTLVLSGGWTDTFDSNGACTTVQSGQPLASGSSVTRTSPTGFTVALTNGIGLVTDTSAHTTYTGLVLPTTGVATTAGTGTRSVVINGLHRLLKTGGGTQLFEQSLTSSGLTMTGSLATANRVVSGTLTTYHDSSSYTSVSTFNNLTWGTSTCCFPTSGSISSVLSGGYTGSQTMTFTSVCGLVNSVSLSGAATTSTLSYCM